MKTVNFIAIFSMMVAFVACGSGAMSPKAFDSAAIEIFKGANNTLNEFDAKITAGVKSNNLPSIAAAAESALAKVEKQIEKLQAIEAPENAEAYKESVLKCLDGVKALIKTGEKYAALKEGYAKSEFAALEKEYNTLKTQLSKNLKGVATAQSEFMKMVNP